MTHPILKLVWVNLTHRPLGTALTVITLAASVALISLLLQFGVHVESRIKKDIAGVDLVVGAKGSPLQLILSSLLHIDVPTGNIPVAEAQVLLRDPQVQAAVPLALGDSFRGFRIVGTTPEFLQLYKAPISTGQRWSGPQQVVIGAAVHKTLNMDVGQQFFGAHGLSTTGKGLMEHAHAPYKVVGVLAPMNSVVDRLILTPLDSVWAAHKNKHENSHDEDHDTHNKNLFDFHMDEPSNRKITALLIKYRSPITAVRLPRSVNAKTGLQAAAPAIEITRLFRLSSGLASAAIAVAVLLAFIGSLSIFSVVSNTSVAGLYDIALMRAMGASQQLIVSQRILEGALLAALSAVVGILLAHLMLFFACQTSGTIAAFGLNGQTFFKTELYVFAGTVVIGAIAALWPALSNYRISPSLLLQRGR